MTESFKPPRHEVDAGTPFTYLIQYPEGRSVLWQGSLMYLLFFLVVPVILLSGYRVSLTRALSRGERPPSVWSFDHMADGLRMSLVSFIFFLPGFLFFGPFVFSQAAFSTGTRVAPLFGLTLFPLIGLSQIYFIFLIGIHPALLAALALRGQISDCFNWSLMRHLIGRFGGHYFIVAVLAYGVRTFAGIGIFACFIGIIFTLFYASTVESHLAAQLLRAHLIEEGLPNR